MHRRRYLISELFISPAAIAESVVLHAFKTGYRHIDSARAYRNEQPCADAIRSSTHSIPRSEVYFTSKVPPRAMGYEAASVIQYSNLLLQEKPQQFRLVLIILCSEIYILDLVPNLPPLRRPLPNPLTLRRPHSPPRDLGRTRLCPKSGTDPLLGRLQLWRPPPRRARIAYPNSRIATRPRRRRHYLRRTMGTAPLATTRRYCGVVPGPQHRH